MFRCRAVLLLALVLIPAPPATAKPAEPAATDIPADLPQRYRDWLEEVAPLMIPEERKVFLSLSRDYQRQAFLRAFWEARDPYPETPKNELRDAWQERLEEARERYGTLNDERSRLLLLNGPPDRVLISRCGMVLRPVELWRLDHSSLVKGTFVIAFVGWGGRGGRYVLWHPSEGLESLVVGANAGEIDQERLLDNIREECMQPEDLLSMLASAVDWEQMEKRGAKPKSPGPEWVQSFVRGSTDLPEDAALLPASLELTYPARHQSRTIVQGLVRIPAAAAVAAGEKDGPLYRFRVDGEVLRKDELFESFRYRFDMPATGNGTEIPLLLERYLRPGDYKLLVRVEDLNGGSFFRHEGEITVPLLPATPAVANAVDALAAPSQAVPAAPASPAAAVSAAAAALADDVVVQLSPPPADLLTGRLRVAANVRGEGVARVRFVLDGHPLLAKSKPPYTVELDLGQEPRLHHLEVVAEGADGRELARDEVAVNAGPHRFAVRLVEPRGSVAEVGGAPAGLPLRAEAVVDVPGDERLDRLELFLDDTHLATLYQPPFVQSLVPPPGRRVSYVRAVAYLQSGAVTEDLVLLNAPPGRASVNVDLVELFTTAIDRRGRPVTDLAASDFRVEEDGRPQQLVRCDFVETLPIHAVVLLDTSASMLEELEQAEGAAHRFFELLLTSRDRAAVMSFADRPVLQVPFTHDPAVLAGGLARLEADGETALYDSVVYALWYMSGIRGKRVLVLLSDGEDVKSKYRFDEVLEFARRSGVAIYAIGLGLNSSAQQARMALTQLAGETGGRVFFVERTEKFDSVYQSIERELRAQYLLAYQSDGTGPGYRKVDVEVKRPGTKASTVKGYYP